MEKIKNLAQQLVSLISTAPTLVPRFSVMPTSKSSHVKKRDESNFISGFICYLY